MDPIYFSSIDIGEQTAQNLHQPTNSFSDYLNGNYAANLFMFPTCEAEILHTTTNLKASTSEGYDNVSSMYTGNKPLILSLGSHSVARWRQLL